MADGILWPKWGHAVGILDGKKVGGKWGITARMVNYYCSAGRIPGTVKKGNLWLVPADAETPVDGRYKNCKANDGDKK